MRGFSEDCSFDCGGLLLELSTGRKMTGKIPRSLPASSVHNSSVASSIVTFTCATNPNGTKSIPAAAVPRADAG